MSLPWLMLMLLAAGPTEAPNVEIGGARLTPPAGFRRVDDALVRGSAALVPLVAGEAPRELLAAFVESGEEASATLVVGKVGHALTLDAGVRTAVASAIAGHFRGELDLEVVVDRPTLVEGHLAPRLEARAHTRTGRGARTVRFAFVPAGAGHFVLAASLPADREAELEEPFSRAFESFDPGAPPPEHHDRALRAVAFGATGIAVVLVLQLWRRRRRTD